MYCQVIVDLAHENTAKPFTYLIPDGMTLLSGQRVLVPFGKRQMEGIVLRLAEETDLPTEKIRKVIRPLEDYAAIPPDLISLAEEIADKNHCPLAETLRLMFPPQMRGERIRIRMLKTVQLSISAEAAEAEIRRTRKGTKKESLLRLLADGRARTMNEIRESVRDPGPVISQLEKAGMVSVGEEESLRIPGGLIETDVEKPRSLTEEQEEVMEEILPKLREGRGAFLLHGVTGSGKTEVFMSAVRKTLEDGKSAIILVPEIALTPQMIAWFRRRFGPVSAVIHSRLSAGERYDEWRRIRRGDARVVIGARSAVFAPVERLGLIIVDEEHESTYLSDHHPRYDARKAAESRCKREHATLILASATPSILSFARARRGDFVLLEMPHRVLNRPMPAVELIDMRRELESGNRTVLSRELRSALKSCAKEGRQAMLLMNRRGYNSFVSCRSCGYVVKCPMCDVSMTYHIGSADGKLRCHYCGMTQEPPTVCPSCGGKYIRYFGAGTQKVEEEVQKLLPGMPTIRMDMDTTRGKDGHSRILEQFRKGEARILIGTQMIAKGLDFPEVTLVGVIAADQTLHLPDYRSRERTFQLLTQVAGRAGRGQTAGRVLIQTYQPENPVIRYAARQDYRAFFEDEFRRRREGMYPPFTILARMLVESPDEEQAVRTAEAVEQRMKALLREHPSWASRVLLMIHDAPSVKVLRGLHRRHILMKLLVGEETERWCAALAEMAEKPEENARIWFEYNPTTMM